VLTRGRAPKGRLHSGNGPGGVAGTQHFMHIRFWPQQQLASLRVVKAKRFLCLKWRNRANDLDTFRPPKKKGFYLGRKCQNELQTSLVGTKNILHTSQLKFPHRQTQGILGVWRECGEKDTQRGEGGQRWPGTSGRTENQLPGKTRATRSKKYATFFHVCGCVGMGVLVWVAVLEKAFLTQRDNV